MPILDYSSTSSESLEDEEEYDPHEVCGFHARIIFYLHSIPGILFYLLAIALGVITLIFPHLHRESSIYRQLFQRYERSNANDYYLYYQIVVASWISLYFLLIISTIFGLIGAKVRRPVLLIPLFVFHLINVGILILIAFALMTINTVGEQWVIWPSVIVVFYLTVSTISLGITLLCYRFVVESHEVLLQLMASTKQVHFNEKMLKRERRYV
uniref:Uncharacterized protein n=1 Tax=Acrobeloides nanus TaxID=290746 RepID=A0A914D7E1_9BILA